MVAFCSHIKLYSRETTAKVIFLLLSLENHCRTGDFLVLVIHLELNSISRGGNRYEFISANCSRVFLWDMQPVTSTSHSGLPRATQQNRLATHIASERLPPDIRGYLSEAQRVLLSPLALNRPCPRRSESSSRFK